MKACTAREAKHDARLDREERHARARHAQRRRAACGADAVGDAAIDEGRVLRDVVASAGSGKQDLVGRVAGVRAGRKRARSATPDGDGERLRAGHGERVRACREAAAFADHDAGRLRAVDAHVVDEQSALRGHVLIAANIQSAQRAVSAAAGDRRVREAHLGAAAHLDRRPRRRRHRALDANRSVGRAERDELPLDEHSAAESNDGARLDRDRPPSRDRKACLDDVGARGGRPGLVRRGRDVVLRARAGQGSANRTHARVDIAGVGTTRG
jgi:hypothetical protein